jgi:hypothetical protein
MLLFWGYSADGLGRNCLEPLSVLLIVWTAAAWPDSWRRWRWLIGIAALESLSVRMIGILCDPSFGPTELSGETLGLAGVAALAALAPPALFLAAAARLSVRSEPSA